jgi:hypothetical protein
MTPTTFMPAAQGSARGAGEVVLWVGILIGAVLVLFLVIQFFRRRLLAPDRPEERDRALLDDLRAMRDSGQITQEEYDAARKSMVARMTARSAPERAGVDEKATGRDRPSAPSKSQ